MGLFAIFGRRHHGRDDVWVSAHPQVIELRTILGLILTKVERLMIDNTRLMASVARLEADDKAAVLALTALRDQNKQVAAQLVDVQKQLADLQASGGTDTAEVQKLLSDVADRLDKTADEVEAGVADNSQVPDMPPAEPPAAPA